MNPDQGFALILVGVFGVIVPFGLAWIIPAARARARRIDREGASVDAEVVAEVDQLRARLGEMEERLDFAERMLAHHGGPKELPGERGR